jgi:hypothetical protein
LIISSPFLHIIERKITYRGTTAGTVDRDDGSGSHGRSLSHVGTRRSSILGQETSLKSRNTDFVGCEGRVESTNSSHGSGEGSEFAGETGER